jgi:hypothetical protein
MVADKPLRPLMASLGTPHKGAMRGNSTNNTTMMGAPSRAIQPRFWRPAAGAVAHRHVAVDQRREQTQQTQQHGGSAMSRLCEKKKLLSR